MMPTPTGGAVRRWPLVLAVVVPLVLATVVGFGVGFGVMTHCTNAFGCTVTSCAPCRPAGAWLNGGWAAQAVLLVAGLVLVLLARRGLRPRTVRVAGLTLAGLSLLLVVVTTARAVHSY